MNIPAEERKRPADDSPLTEPEVKKVIQSVRELSSAPIRADTDGSPPVVLPGLDNDEDSHEDAACYWDASTMAPLNPASAAAIARLRAFKPPPFPLWDRLPVSRRAAVLMLLYADRRGDLRVVITMRAASLRSFSGHAALPGGKADSLEETAYQIARREAWEEIGLPVDDKKIPAPFHIEHLCYLPHSLAKTELAVRPCVAFLHVRDPPIPTASVSGAKTTSTEESTGPTVEESLIPRLDAKEVAAVFSAPFHNFLHAEDEPELQRPPLPAGPWYEGTWIRWYDRMWRMHFFYVPVNNQRVSKPRARDGGLAAIAEQTEEEAEAEARAEGAGRYKVWGMTARMLVDAATVAYGEEPDFEHNDHFGDEGVLEWLGEQGKLGEKKRRGSQSEGGGGDSKKTNEGAKM